MIDQRTAPYGIFLLRVALGVMFISHAYLKIAVFTIPGFEGFLGSVGLPTMLAWPIILAELIGGIAILVGFYGRIAQVLLLPVLVGALFVHAPNGWLFTAENGGWEYPAFLIVGALAHILVGEGAFAVKPFALPARSLQAAAARSTRAVSGPGTFEANASASPRFGSGLHQSTLEQERVGIGVAAAEGAIGGLGLAKIAGGIDEVAQARAPSPDRRCRPPPRRRSKPSASSTSDQR